MHRTIHPKMFYYGFPVVLLTTCDQQGKTNITPISSSWCLGDNIVIGLGTQGKAFDNLQHCGEAVLNLADQSLWQKVERIAPLTAQYPIPDSQEMHYQFCDDKFARGGFTPQASTQIKPARILECPLQAETRVEQINLRDGYAIVELKMLVVHAQADLIFDDDKINPEKWQPLIYNFRHYHGLGDTLAKNFRA